MPPEIVLRLVEVKPVRMSKELSHKEERGKGIRLWEGGLNGWAIFPDLLLSSTCGLPSIKVSLLGDRAGDGDWATPSCRPSFFS